MNAKIHGVLSDADALRIVAWVQDVNKMREYSNDELARSLLTVGPHFGKLSDLIEIAAERLAPGVIQRMADEQEAKETAAAEEAKRKAQS